MSGNQGDKQNDSPKHPPNGKDIKGKNSDQINDNLSSQQPNDETLQLEQKLKDVGLGKKWLVELKKLFCITSVESLQHLTRKDLLELQKLAEYSWEKSALRSLIVGNESKMGHDFKAQDAFQDNMSKKNRELEDFSKHAHIEKDFIAKSNDPNYKTTIDSLLPKSSESSVLRKELNTIEVIQNASGGKALMGIYYLKHDMGDIVHKSKTVIRVNTNVTLKTPTISQHDKTFEFTSKKKLDQFNQSVHTIGLSSDGSLKLESCLETGFSTSTKIDKTVTSEEHSESVFHSRVKCAFVPVKSCELKIENIFFESYSLASLQQIEAEMNNCDNCESLHSNCLSFFNDYGSHVNVGIIHFGGIFSWTATYEGEKDSKKTFSSDLLHVALGAYTSCEKSYFKTSCGGKISGSFLSQQNKLSGRFDESEMSKVQLTISKYGGPPEADEFTDWKHGLTMNNSTWHLIGRVNFVGVWTILQNHSTDFNDFQKVAKLMEATWRLEAVKESLPCEKEKDRVIELLETISHVSQVMFEIVGKINSFTGMLETNRQFSELFVDAISLTQSGVTEIKPLLKNILSSVLHINFYQKERIISWIGDTQEDAFLDSRLLISEKIETVDTLISVLKKKIIPCMKPKSRIQNISSQLLFVCSQLLTNLLEKNVYHYAMFLSFLTMLKYDIEYKSFENDLTILELDQFIKALESQKNMFDISNNGCDFPQQISVLHCVIDNINKYANKASECFFVRCASTLTATFDPDIAVIVQRFMENKSHNWQRYLEELDSLKMGKANARIQYELPIWEIQAPKSLNTEQMPTEIFELDEESMVFLKTFELYQYFPCKLTFMDAITIKKQYKKQGINHIPRLVLDHILMVNREGRDRSIFNYIDELKSRSKKAVERNAEDTWPDDSSDSSDSDSDECNEQDDVNPLDILLSLFYCSSYMLQQVMASKLFSSGIAFPFIFPLSKKKQALVLLGALRSIVLDIKSENNILKIPSVDIPCHVVSFIRIGTPRFSKSVMINKVLSYHDLHTFFNQDCPNGKIKRKISNGLVEAYLIPPSEIADPKTFAFQNMILFLNLRGDACDYHEHKMLLAKISTVIVVAVTSESLKEENTKAMIKHINDSNSSIIIALDKSSKVSSELFTNLGQDIEIVKMFHKGKQKDWSKVQRQMYLKLSHIMEKKQKQTLKNRFRKCNTIDKISVCLDEGYLNVVDRDAATELVSNLQSISDIEGPILPLQTKLINISALTKTLKSSSEIDSGRHKQTSRYLHAIREEQLKMGTKLNSFMISFLRHTIVRLKNGSEQDLMTFFNCLKTYLDEHYRSRFHSDRTKKTNDKHRDSSFDFEHILREVAQIFESFTDLDNLTSTKTSSIVNLLPSIAEKCLMIGLPVELMDGENGYIPITWVNAVFKALSTVLGDNKKCLVLSVIGIQSTGKSTLLNTMFGLNFPVRAGKCTAGVFMQIVPVEGKPFDYILVLDTEGLRGSSRKDMVKFDNELATFAVGLADIFIVNIKGEASQEMKEVIAMVVSALLRLEDTRINFDKKCILVHQNVSSKHALQLTQDDRKHFLDYLDESTAAVAKDLNKHRIKTFNDVINVNEVENIWYLPDLLCGTYPMQYSNNAYSTSVLKLKTFVLDKMYNADKKYLNLCDVYLKIKTMWEGILGHDQLFHFQNPLSMRSYDIMYRQVLSLTRSLHSFGERLMIDKCNCLRTCHSIQEAAPVERERFYNEMEQMKEKNIVDYNEFIENHSLLVYMSVWRDSMGRLLSFSQDHKIQDLLKSFDNQVELNEIQIKNGMLRAKFESNLHQVAKVLNKEDKDIGGEEILREKFDAIWEAYKATLLQKTVKKNIKETIERVINATYPADDIKYIKECLQNDEITNNEKLSKLIDSISLENIETEHHLLINESWMPMEKERQNQNDCKIKAVKIANTIFSKIDSYLKAHICEDTVIEERFVITSLQYIDKAVESFQSEQFSLRPAFHAMLISRVLEYLQQFFFNLNKKREEKDLHYRYQSMRLFKDLVNDYASNTVVSGYFLESLTSGVQDYVSKILPVDIQDFFASKEFEMSKCKLITAILKDLADKSQFDSFKMYIDEPEEYALIWITHHINNRLFCKSKDNKLSKYGCFASEHIKQIFDIVRKSISVILTRFQERKECVPQLWIEHYTRAMGKSNLSLLNVENVMFLRENVTDVEIFSNAILERLDDVEEKIIKQFNDTNADNVDWKENPFFKLMETLWGCKERCPFCNETCKHSYSSHLDQELQHECWQHRPQGLGDIATICRFLIVFKRNVLVSSCCNELLETDEQYKVSGSNTFRKFKDYKKDYPDWNIKPSSDISKYWIWVFTTYKAEIQKLNKGTKMPKFPTSWNVTKEAALNSLETNKW